MAQANELREMTVEDLERRAVQMKQTLFQDQMKMRTGTLDNPAERTGHKRELARILGVLTEKKRAAAKA